MMRRSQTPPRPRAPSHAPPRAPLAAALTLALAACLGTNPGDSDGTATQTGSTTSTTGSSTSTTGATTTATGEVTSTTVASTTGDTDTDAIDVACTYPGSTSAGPQVPDLAPECACVGDKGLLLCQSPICPSIIGKCSPSDLAPECDGTWSYDEVALQCALEAARDGTEGTIRWSFWLNGGIHTFGGFLHIVPDRRAIRQDYEVNDLDEDVSNTDLWQLRDPQYFAGCLELATVCERMDCFFAGTTGSALSLCLPGFHDSDI